MRFFLPFNRTSLELKHGIRAAFRFLVGTFNRTSLELKQKYERLSCVFFYCF